MPATSSPIDRAKVLEKRISEVYPGRSVHLIGTVLSELLDLNMSAEMAHPF